tara:strand:- start:8364 stop:8522 length:159 start_codon:yes stop_codon:yes gene_type:complete
MAGSHGRLRIASISRLKAKECLSEHSEAKQLKSVWKWQSVKTSKGPEAGPGF